MNLEHYILDHIDSKVGVFKYDLIGYNNLHRIISASAELVKRKLALSEMSISAAIKELISKEHLVVCPYSHKMKGRIFIYGGLAPNISSDTESFSQTNPLLILRNHFYWLTQARHDNIAYELSISEKSFLTDYSPDYIFNPTSIKAEASSPKFVETSNDVLSLFQIDPPADSYLAFLLELHKFLKYWRVNIKSRITYNFFTGDVRTALPHELVMASGNAKNIFAKWRDYSLHLLKHRELFNDTYANRPTREIFQMFGITNPPDDYVWYCPISTLYWVAIFDSQLKVKFASYRTLKEANEAHARNIEKLDALNISIPLLITKPMQGVYFYNKKEWNEFWRTHYNKPVAAPEDLTS